MASRKTPGKFRSEAHETDWWVKNQDYTAKRFEVIAGRLIETKRKVSPA